MLENLENIPGYQNRSQMCGPEWSNRWVQQPRAARCKLRKWVPWDWSWMLATVSWSCLRMMIKPELSGMKRIHFEAPQACKSKKLTAAWVSWSISIHFHPFPAWFRLPRISSQTQKERSSVRLWRQVFWRHNGAGNLSSALSGFHVWSFLGHPTLVTVQDCSGGEYNYR